MCGAAISTQTSSTQRRSSWGRGSPSSTSCTWRSSTPGTVQCSTVYSTVQYSAVYRTVQYSTVQLDTRALALLADSCTNLTTLGFYNCGFREPGAGAGAGAELLAADVAARRREQEEEAALALSCSWLDVERLTITSEVGVPEDILYSVLTW